MDFTFSTSSCRQIRCYFLQSFKPVTFYYGRLALRIVIQYGCRLGAGLNLKLHLDSSGKSIQKLNLSEKEAPRSSIL
jgi:hypothetical protein